jgi:hypothetical protein
MLSVNKVTTVLKRRGNHRMNDFGYGLKLRPECLKSTEYPCDSNYDRAVATVVIHPNIGRLILGE